MRDVRIIGLNGAFALDAVLYDSGLIFFKDSQRWSFIAKELQEQKTVVSVVNEIKQEPQDEAPKRGRKPKGEKLN